MISFENASSSLFSAIIDSSSVCLSLPLPRNIHRGDPKQDRWYTPRWLHHRTWPIMMRRHVAWLIIVIVQEQELLIKFRPSTVSRETMRCGRVVSNYKCDHRVRGCLAARADVLTHRISFRQETICYAEKPTHCRFGDFKSFAPTGAWGKYIGNKMVKNIVKRFILGNFPPKITETWLEKNWRGLTWFPLEWMNGRVNRTLVCVNLQNCCLSERWSFGVFCIRKHYIWGQPVVGYLNQAFDKHMHGLFNTYTAIPMIIWKAVRQIFLSTVLRVKTRFYVIRRRFASQFITFYSCVVGFLSIQFPMLFHSLHCYACFFLRWLRLTLQFNIYFSVSV